MTVNVDLHIESRKITGKTTARQLRNQGKIPAIIYGEKKKPEHIALENKAITKLYNTGHLMSTLLHMDIEGTKIRTIVRDVQLDPVRDTIIHVDFLRLGKDAKIAVEVPIHLLNEDTCPGLKRGGVLNIVRFTIELLCPADNIPNKIEIDLNQYDMGIAIHISDISLPDNVTPTITDRDFTIATIVAPASESEDTETGEETEESDDDDDDEESS